MASNINPYNIDGTFPVAGQDNSSQGFRDNFTNIKNNFTYAQNELTDLQNKAIVGSALTGQTINNDMAGTQIKRPQLTAWTQSYLNKGYVGTGTTCYLDFGSEGNNANGANFQSLTTTGSSGTITLQFTGWPTSTGAGSLGYGVMRVWIIVSNTAHTITLPASVTYGIADMAGVMANLDGTNTITFDAPGNYIFDFSSIDGGTTYQIFDLTRNRISFRDPTFYYNQNVNPTLLIGFNEATISTAIGLETGADTIAVLGSFNSVGANSNFTGNVFNTFGDTTSTPGYSITGIRGDLTTGNFTTIVNNDLIGYYSAITYTGNGTVGGNTFTNSGSIAFYAKGSNVTLGLGANIAFFTAADKTSSYGLDSGTGVASRALKQAIGIENDQSTNLYGNLTVAGNISTTGRRVDTGFAVVVGASSAATGPYNSTSYTIPNNVNTVIVDNDGLNTVNSGNVYNLTITLPSNPVHGQQVKMVFLANVVKLGTTTNGANIYPGSTNSLKYYPSGYPNVANASVFTYTFVNTIGANVVNTWYRF